jgi:phosphomannomutase
MIPQSFDWARLQNGSDIRGVALDGVPGEAVNLPPAVMTRLGQAFATWLSQTQYRSPEQLTVALGRDSRLSGSTLLTAVSEGIRSTGMTVTEVGLASTPAMFMSTLPHTLDCDGAIMLTASHLPFNRNGLKFFTKSGGLGKPDITEIIKLAQSEDIPLGEMGQRKENDFISTYAQGLVQMIREGVNHPDHFETPLSGLKIIVDAGNGAGGFFARMVLEPLGADTQGSQFLEPDGNFPNHIPNPEDEEAIASLRQAVIKNNADFGLIFDTDVDRAGAVDGEGQDLNRNRLIALIASIILEEHPGSTIVTDSITSDGLTTFIHQDLQGKHHRFVRGYKNVINEAIRLNDQGEESWLAIETSGHAALKENYFLDDGAYLVSKLLVALAQSHLTGKTLTDRIAKLQEPQESKEFRLKIGVSEFKSYGNDVMEHLNAYCQTRPNWEIVPNTYEGIRVKCLHDQEQGWFSLRMSLHDPVLPLNIESNVAGGVHQISQSLLPFFSKFEALNLAPLQAR